eukprot:PhM_4_TR8312/c3_g1_i10/m.77730
MVICDPAVQGDHSAMIPSRCSSAVRKVHSKWNEATLFDTVLMNELISDISDKCETEFHIEDGGKREVVSKSTELHTFVSKPETKREDLTSGGGLKDRKRYFYNPSQKGTPTKR